MPITEKQAHAVIAAEKADLNGSLEQRAQYTSAARCFAGDLAKEWLSMKERIAELEGAIAPTVPCKAGNECGCAVEGIG